MEMEHAHRERVGLFKPPSSNPTVHRQLDDHIRMGGVSIIQSSGLSILVFLCLPVKSMEVMAYGNISSYVPSQMFNT